MKVLLLSAYAAHSHRHWVAMLQAMCPSWEWRVLELPPRFFSWRVRGNALYWSMADREILEADYDLLLVTSMVDLATLRGLVPALACLPTIVYFHENQFAYPQGEHQSSLVDAQLTSIYSALAADRILFNSHYNRDSFNAGCAALLGKLPDRVPQGVVELLTSKADVLPVPIDVGTRAETRPYWPGRTTAGCRGITRLVWLGRFEHDKGGEALLAILQKLEDFDFKYELAVVGQQFRQTPVAFEAIRQRYEHRLVQFGYLEDVNRYRGLLAAADTVLSTALHEFQGLAVLEAVSLGCVPVVPDRLVYREIFPAGCRYASCPGDAAREALAAAMRVFAVARGSVSHPDIGAFRRTRLAPLYRQVLRTVYRRGIVSEGE